MNIKQVVAVATMAIAAAFSSNADAHAKLESSYPKAGGVVAVTPKEIRLQFNEQVELAFSNIKLVDQKGNVIKPSKVALDQSNPRIMVAIIPPVGAGFYQVQWTTLTRDGHKVKGTFPFQVK
jgi:methionine-rich copper-binding protein CopC